MPVAYVTVEVLSKDGDYTLELNDAGKILLVNVADANTVTIPKNIDVTFPIGTIIMLCQDGAGQTTVSPASGVTLSKNSALSANLTGQYSVATLFKKGTDTWVIGGDLEAA